MAIKKIRWINKSDGATFLMERYELTINYTDTISDANFKRLKEQFPDTMELHRHGQEMNSGDGVAKERSKICTN